MEQKEIVYLPIEKLEHHPDNPRKDLGDLSELSDSIRQNGIYQNLTVVPAGEKYYVVIGNRRMEAAKMAGLDRLPCVISEMSRQEQVVTMLAENMQRNDLTVWEQGCGFQLAMDLGETIDSIAEKSGFSKQTVKRRAKLAELDQEKLKKASQRQITIAELDQLNRVEDLQTRNSLLNFIGTSSFAQMAKREIDTQVRKKSEAKARKVLIAAGLKEIDYHGDCFGGKYKVSKRAYVKCDDISNDYVKEDDEQYFGINYGTVYFRRKPTKDEAQKENRLSEETKKQRYNNEHLKEISRRVYELRRKFVFEITEEKAKANFPVIVEFLFRHEWDNRVEGGYWSRYQREKFTDQKIDFQKGYSEIEPMVSANLYQSLWRHGYVLSADYEEMRYMDYIGNYRKNGRLDMIYEILIKMGYEMSEEEKALQDGTHELFQKEK